MVNHRSPPQLCYRRRFLAALAATTALACDSCYGPANPAIHTRLVRRMQPDALNATVSPKRPLAWGQLNYFTGNTNYTKVITAANLTKEQWFIDAVNTPKPVDLSLLIGHNPVRPSDSESTIALVQKAIHKARPNTPIQVFGGHSQESSHPHTKAR